VKEGKCFELEPILLSGEKTQPGPRGKRIKTSGQAILFVKRLRGKEKYWRLGPEKRVVIHAKPVEVANTRREEKNQGREDFHEVQDASSVVKDGRPVARNGGTLVGRTCSWIYGRDDVYRLPGDREVSIFEAKDQPEIKKRCASFP